jgi:hypothetical protein
MTGIIRALDGVRSESSRNVCDEVDWAQKKGCNDDGSFSPPESSSDYVSESDVTITVGVLSWFA